MKLSMMSYTMGRQPQYFNIKEMLELTRELNMDGIDFVTLHGTDSKELRKMTDDHGVPVVCYTFQADLNHFDAGARKSGVETAKREIEAAKVLGAPVIMIVTPSKKGIDRDIGRRNWINGLTEVAPFAADAGVTLTIENFPGADSSFVIADDMLEAVREVPGLKITYDNGNAASGEEPAASFTRCAQHVVHSHFKDWYMKDSECEGYHRMLDGRYYKPALIGEGCVDHKRCLAAMKAAGYDGFINVEYEGDEYRPVEAVRRAVDYLRDLMVRYLNIPVSLPCSSDSIGSDARKPH